MQADTAYPASGGPLALLSFISAAENNDPDDCAMHVSS